MTPGNNKFKICIQKFFIFVKKFYNLENPQIFSFFVFQCCNENMFIIEMEDGREAPKKPSKIKFELRFLIQGRRYHENNTI